MDPVGIPSNRLNLLFGLNNPNFSDRIIRLEIVELHKDDDDVRHRKFLLKDTTTAPPHVKTIHICSLILAARSLFFLKLFSNGMLESENKHVTLQIEASEEVPFMDLQYVYSNNMPTTCNALLDLLVIADKFEVESCLRECSQLLQKLPITCESASLYLDLPPALLNSSTVYPLIEMAKDFLVERFKDFNGDKDEEMLDLSLPCIQAILSSDDLQVSSEDDVFEFVLEWVDENYPINVEERREILGTRLLNLVRFPFMTTTCLVDNVLACSDIDHEVTSKIVIQALSFKAETPHGRHWLAAEDDIAESHQYVERAYTIRPLKVVKFEVPHQQSIVYLQFTREELMHTFPDDEIRSETFLLGGHQLVLTVACGYASGGPTDKYYFWLALEVDEESAATFTVNYEIALRMKPSKKFKRWIEESQAFTEQEHSMYLRQVPWTDFIADENTYFIDGIFHLRADLTIKNDK